MKVFWAPDYSRTNPYQRLLAQGMAERGVATVPYPRGPRPRLFPIARWMLPSARRGDVLHLHWTDVFMRSGSRVRRALEGVRFLLDLLLVRASGMRLAWTLHNMDAHDGAMPAIDRVFARATAALAGVVIVHSDAAAVLARQHLRVPGRKLQVIPQGHYRGVYGLPVAREDARAALGLPATARIFLFAGMVRRYKGLEELLDAWRCSMPAGGDDAPLLLVAGLAKEDAYARTIQALAAAAGGNVRLDLRWLGDQELPLYLGAADVAVFPFRKITNSGSILLALSYGLPVIAPDLPVLREMLGEATGLLYPPEEGGLQDALARAGTMDLDHLRVAAAAACDGLDWGTVATRTLRAYEEAA